MTENEVLIKTPEEAIETIKSNMPTSGYQMLRESLDMAIEALKEVQQYREIGASPEQLKELIFEGSATKRILRHYQEIGTVEECKEAVERQRMKMIEVVNIENFVVNKLYVPYLAKIFKNTEDFGNKITGKENILKYFEECDMVRELQIDPNLIIQLFDDRPDIKEIAFNALKESGGVKWYRYLDMNNPVIRWVNENLEGME